MLKKSHLLIWLLTCCGYVCAANAESIASDNAAQGKILYFQCRACHALNAGEAHKIGPNLHGFYGEKAGTRQGYTYSDALLASGVVWTESSLDAWLKRPAELVPGNKMVYQGLADESGRRALIDYLIRATGN